MLKVWSAGGAAAADAVVLDLAMPLFSSDDVRMVPSAVAALDAGQSRPVFAFKGR